MLRASAGSPGAGIWSLPAVCADDDREQIHGELRRGRGDDLPGTLGIEHLRGLDASFLYDGSGQRVIQQTTQGGATTTTV